MISVCSVSNHFLVTWMTVMSVTLLALDIPISRSFVGSGAYRTIGSGSEIIFVDSFGLPKMVFGRAHADVSLKKIRA